MPADKPLWHIVYSADGTPPPAGTEALCGYVTKTDLWDELKGDECAYCYREMWRRINDNGAS